MDKPTEDKPTNKKPWRTTVRQHIEQHHRKYLWSIATAFALSLLWDRMPMMAKVVVVIVTTLFFIYLIVNSNTVSTVMKFLAGKRIYMVIVLCILAIVLEGVVYRDNIKSYFTATPSQNLVITPDFNPGIATSRYALLLEFGVQRDDLDPVEITIDAGNVTFDSSGAWFDQSHMPVPTSNWTGINSNSPDFTKFYQTITMPFHYGTYGLPLTPQRSFYVLLNNSQPFSIKTVVFGGKHFHAVGTKFVLDNP